MNVPLAKVQLYDYENQTLEAFVAVRCLYAKFDCPVAHQNGSLFATAHDCETGFFLGDKITALYKKCYLFPMIHRGYPFFTVIC